MATVTDYQRLRMDLGLQPDDESQIDNDQAELLFVRAGETYTDAASAATYTRVLAIRGLLVQAANEVDYTQNESSEKASQRFAHLSKLLDLWRGELAAVVGAAAGSSARFGKTTRRPARVKEYPGSWGW